MIKGFLEKNTASEPPFPTPFMLNDRDERVRRPPEDGTRYRLGIDMMTKNLEHGRKEAVEGAYAAQVQELVSSFRKSNSWDWPVDVKINHQSAP